MKQSVKNLKVINFVMEYYKYVTWRHEHNTTKTILRKAFLLRLSHPGAYNYYKIFALN